MASVYAMLSEIPGDKQLANAHLTQPFNFLIESSKGRCEKETTITFRKTADFLFVQICQQNYWS